MKTLLLLCLPLFALTPEQKRADEWRKLVRESDAAVEKVKAFEASWQRDCSATGLVLTLKANGDPGCVAKPVEVPKP